MGYNKSGYYKRAAMIKEITEAHYAPYHDQCKKMVWKKYINNQFGIGYRTYLKYTKTNIPSIKEPIQYRIKFDE